MQSIGTASRREPALNIPMPLLVWIALLVAIHAGRMLLPAPADPQLLLNAAFIPAPWSVSLGVATADDIVASIEGAGSEPEAAYRLLVARIVLAQPPRPWSPVTYSLLHGSWMHLGFNCFLLVVFASSVVRRSGILASLALWLVAALGGALAMWLFDPRDVDLTIGASASTFGFMAPAATFSFAKFDDGTWDFLRNRGALTLLALWLAGNAAVGLFSEPGADIAWIAHVGGLLAGVALYPLIHTGRPAPA